MDVVFEYAVWTPATPGCVRRGSPISCLDCTLALSDFTSSSGCSPDWSASVPSSASDTCDDTIEFKDAAHHNIKIQSVTHGCLYKNTHVGVDSSFAVISLIRSSAA